ncbi:MAG TPA: preprotein translocase subunit SecG [Candidatus Omnitrophota bacterium]|nr:preprotein translocase subunit SecG [Candidatus Omnitrophota bacterium]HPD84063.1 preprotein translocase subunit SecG [Candidatus Omnitrophota bacterium]HRZ02920.1 preprotein translocase subunit SecG [Candidatus Omnitrophota bacterium]
MFGFIVFIHVLLCILITIVILMQAGKGGGLAESFSSAESMFGAKTNTILVKTTAVFVSIFLVTCLSLAVISSKANRSLIDKEAIEKAVAAAASGQPVDQKAAGAASAQPGTISGAQAIQENAQKENLPNQQSSQPNEPKNPQK